MSEFISDISEEILPLDENGFTIKPTISDNECILICIKNAPCGTNRKQVMRLIEMYSEKCYQEVNS